MNYSLATLWHERPRYLPGIGAVAFSAVLIALQCGLLLGLFKITSIPVDHTRADVWIGSPEVLSVDLGRPIPNSQLSRVAGDPRVKTVEPYYQSFGSWIKPNGGSELCILIGCSLEDDSLGAITELTPELRAALTSSFLAKLGALLARPALRAFRDKLNPPAAAPLLGLNGLVIKCHGGANAAAFGQSIDLAVDLAKSDFAAEIERNMTRLLVALEAPEDPVEELS